MANTASSSTNTTTSSFSNLPKVAKVIVKISGSATSNSSSNYVTLSLQLPYAGVNPLSGAIKNLSGTTIFTFENANNGLEFRENELAITFNALTILSTTLPATVKVVLNWPEGTVSNYENIECTY